MVSLFLKKKPKQTPPTNKRKTQLLSILGSASSLLQWTLRLQELLVMLECEPRVTSNIQFSAPTVSIP